MKMDRPHVNTNPVTGSDIALDNLCYSVDGKDILKSISWQSDAARVGVVGRNGSGKSTLARILAGLIEASSGSALINGHDLAKDRKVALTEVGILFQNPDHQIIFPTVQEEISFGLRQLGQSRNEAEQTTQTTLAYFGKSHWAEVSVSVLSQGQKHLVCLMAVCAMKPRMIILDEPFSGIDIPTKMQLKRYLSHYEGGLLHIAHDPDDLSGYDQIIWLEKGSVVQTGKSCDVLPAYISEMNALGGSDDISDLAR